MRWPFPSGTSTDAHGHGHGHPNSTSNSNPNLNSDDTPSPSAKRGKRDIPLLIYTHFLDPLNLATTLLLTAASLSVISGYRTYLRRIPVASGIQERVFRRRSLLGRVTSVGDGDNFRLFHTPGGRLAGWGWLPGRKVPVKRDLLKDRTIHVRLAGVDAPELAHFGRPPQPYAAEALAWLRGYVMGRRVRAYVYKRDQYDRAVATVYVWKGLLRRDVGLQMIRQGLATVYEAKTGAEFGDVEDKYRKAEWWAKTKRKGMWAAAAAARFESPRDYKTRMASLDDKAHVKR